MAAPEGRGGDVLRAEAVSGGDSPTLRAAEIANLLRDCLTLWNIPARMTLADDVITVDAPDGAFTLQQASADLRPVRWFLQTPTRAAANRPPRALPSIVAALSALRNALGGDPGSTLRIGAGASSA